jgi:hypothetical protein
VSDRRLPIVVYIHGGSFCTESAFCRTYHRYATSLVASAGAIVVSVEYCLAPEHPILAAYDDTWSELQWVASLADPWLADYADPARTFLTGDSTGGNIVYHTAVRASREGIGIKGAIIVQPYFWGAERLPSQWPWRRGTPCGNAGAACSPASATTATWRRWWSRRGRTITTRKRSIGTSTLVPVKDEPALTCLNSVRRAR